MWLQFIQIKNLINCVERKVLLGKDSLYYKMQAYAMTNWVWVNSTVGLFYTF